MRRGIVTISGHWMLHLILIYLFPLPICYTADYRVDVTTTADQKHHPGPDSITYITLEGNRGRLDKRKLPTGVREARLDTLPITGATDVGILCRVILAPGTNDSLFVGTVFVRIDDVDERSQLFIFNQWLTDHSYRVFKVHGKWSDWSSWDPCACKNNEIQSRKRTCDRPLPGCGGEPCKGDNVETRQCVDECTDRPRAGETTVKTDILPWLIGIIACCVLITLLLVIIAVLCCKYRDQKRKLKQSESPYATTEHNKVPSNQISFISNGNVRRGDQLVANLAEQVYSTYAGSQSTIDRDSGILVKSRDTSESEPKYDEQNNCVDYVYYTYNSGGRKKDANGNAPMFVPCVERPKRPAQWEVNDMYETNVTVL